MYILNISAECFPIAKVGGLADVVGALPKYLNNLAVFSQVIIPFYANKFTANKRFDVVFESELKMGDLSYKFQILELKEDLGFRLFLVKIPNLLDLENVYGYQNDSERFIAFQIAVLDWLKQKKVKPNIIHCHDHHTGLIPFMLSHAFDYISIKEIPSVFTIHNAQYQGQFDHDKLNLIPIFNPVHIGLLDWDGKINPMATAVKCAWRVTTVSPGYMDELKENANGLEGLLSHESAKCLGILNGIDSKVWNPETDDYIIKKYSENTVQL